MWYDEREKHKTSVDDMMRQSFIEGLAFRTVRDISVNTSKDMARKNIEAMQVLVETGMMPAELQAARANNGRVAKDIAEMLYGTV